MATSPAPRRRWAWRRARSTARSGNTGSRHRSLGACQLMDLTEAEVARYACQLALPGFGAEGQVALRTARVHVVGAGVVAVPALLYLAQAGVGTLYLDDAHDVAA